MNIDSIKIELIDWIARLNDAQTIDKVLTLKKELHIANSGKKKAKIFGSGKHLVKHISDDFNAPLADFKEYLK